jgi:hypothetical protein
MKKITFLTIAFCCLVFSSYAQINKGTVFLGGSLGFAHQKTETNGTESKQNVANILPAIGIAVRNNLVAGVQLAYSNNRLSDDVMGSEPYSRSYGGGVFVKKYRPLGRNFLLFGEASLDVRHIESQSYVNIDYSVDGKGWQTSAGIHPGIAYSLSKHLQLEVALGDLVNISYSHSNNNNITIGGVTKTTQSNFSINTYFSSATNIYLGFRVLL